VFLLSVLSREQLTELSLVTQDFLSDIPPKRCVPFFRFGFSRFSRTFLVVFFRGFSAFATWFFSARNAFFWVFY